MCRLEKWSSRQLQERIQSMLYERTAISKKLEETILNDLKLLKKGQTLNPNLVFRDPYFLDFFGISDTYSEKDLETSNIVELQRFIIEMGSDFAFMSRQKRISIDNRDYYIGTGDIIRLCNEKSLKEPEYIQEENFRTIIWRTLKTPTGQATRQATGHATGHANESIIRVVLILDGEMNRAELQKILGLKHRENFILNYLTPSLESAYIEMTIPDIHTHQDQRYRLTAKGIEFKKNLEKVKKSF